MYRKNTLIILTIILIWTTAQTQIKSPNQIVEEAKAMITQISAEELKTKMDSEEEFFLIDIRTEKEYLSGHIESAVWIPRGKIEFTIQEMTTDPKAEIIIYCRSGGRSSLSLLTLNNMGYEKAFNLDGGFNRVGD